MVLYVVLQACRMNDRLISKERVQGHSSKNGVRREGNNADALYQDSMSYYWRPADLRDG